MVWAKEGSRNWVPTPNWTPAVGIPVGRDFTMGRPQSAQDPSTVHHHAWSPSEEPRGRKMPGSEDPTPNPNRFQIIRSAVVTQVREIRALRLRRSVGENRPHLKGEQPEEPPSPLMVPSSAVSLHQIRHNSSRSRWSTCGTGFYSVVLKTERVSQKIRQTTRTVELTLRPAATETYPYLGKEGGVPPNNAKTKLFRQRRTRSEREKGWETADEPTKSPESWNYDNEIHRKVSSRPVF